MISNMSPLKLGPKYSLRPIQKREFNICLNVPTFTSDINAGFRVTPKSTPSKNKSIPVPAAFSRALKITGRS